MMKNIIEILDTFLRSIYLIDLRDDMYDANIVSFLIGWGIFTLSNTGYTLFGERSYFNYMRFNLLSSVVLIFINQIYFIILLTIFSLFGPISLIIFFIIYCIVHLVACNDNIDAYLFGISRSIDKYFSNLDKYYYDKSEFKKFHQFNLNFYKNFIKTKNI